MRVFSIGIVLMSGLLVFAASPVNPANPMFQAFCVDGDGPLSDWVGSRYEAYLAGRDHERANRGHRWELLVQQGDDPVLRIPSCALVSEGSKPGTLKLENQCDKCVKFTISRTMADGNVKTKDVTIQAKKTRYFRKLSDAVVSVEGESDCN